MSTFPLAIAASGPPLSQLTLFLGADEKLDSANQVNVTNDARPASSANEWTLSAACLLNPSSPTSLRSCSQSGPASPPPSSPPGPPVGTPYSNPPPPPPNSPF